MDSAGNFLVVWRSGSGVEAGPDGDGVSVQGQFFTADGMPSGGELQINTFTTGSQSSPSVSADDAGNFVVVWSSISTPGQDGDGASIQGQRFTSDGMPLGGEFQVNVATMGFQEIPVVASNPMGGFVVAWASETDLVPALLARRFGSDGLPLGGEIAVGEVIGVKDLAVSPSGFVVVWDSFSYPAARRFATDGSPLGNAFSVDSVLAGSPSIAADSEGDFVIVWANNGDVPAQRFASDGTLLGAELQINSSTSGSNPDVASDAAGNFAVVWSRSVGGDLGIRGQRVAVNGTFLGGEFQVESYTTGNQLSPAVASDAAGNLVVVWSGPEIHGQRFASDESADLAISKDDGVDKVLPGAQVVYTIVAENLGPSSVGPVTVTDVFAPELTCDWTSTAAGGASGNSSGSGDLNEALSLPLNSSVTYTVTCDVAVEATGTLTNTATISSPLPDPVPSNNSATDDDTRLRIADLSVTQTDSPDPVSVDSPLTYTIQVESAGPEPAEDVRVTLVLPTGAVFVDVMGTDWVCTGAGSIVVCGLSVLGVGSAPPLTVMVTTPTFETVLNHQVLVSADELDPNPENNLSSELTTVTPALIFSDGFESGDVLRWSSSSP